MSRSIALGVLLGILLAAPQLRASVPDFVSDPSVGAAFCLFALLAPQFIAWRNSRPGLTSALSVLDALHRYVDLYALLISFCLVLGVGGLVTSFIGTNASRSVWPYLYFVAGGLGFLLARPKDCRFGTGRTSEVK